MQSAHQYDFSFGESAQKIPHITITIKKSHFPCVEEELSQAIAHNRSRHTPYFEGNETTFLLFEKDLFTTVFGYGGCGYVSFENEKVHLHVRLAGGMGKYHASATLFVLLGILQSFTDYDAVYEWQIANINLYLERDSTPCGHAVGGWLSGAVILWLREYVAKTAQGVTETRLPQEITNAMRLTWQAVADKELREWDSDIFASVQASGAFALNCFGNSCDLSVYPDETAHEFGEIVMLDCHNLDIAEQQLTLLAGLAKLCELFRNNTAALPLG